MTNAKRNKDKKKKIQEIVKRTHGKVGKKIRGQVKSKMRQTTH